MESSLKYAGSGHTSYPEQQNLSSDASDAAPESRDLRHISFGLV